VKLLIAFIGLFCTVGFSYGQGPYAPNSETAGTDALHFTNNKFISWASDIKVIRGYQDIANKSLGTVNFGESINAIGMSNKSVISLGDSGVANVSFEGYVLNKSGPDFAVFENSFNHEFLELAFVEVSKDGTNFIRFPASSETSSVTQVGSFDLLDATNINNLAGKYKVQYGTPFDLDDIGMDSIRYIRIVDVVGSIDSTIGSKDAKGRMINDPYPTDFQNNGFYTGGFDLESVGLINYEGEIFLGANELSEQKSRVRIYPNPAISDITITVEKQSEIQIHDVNGKLWFSQRINFGSNSLDLNDLPRGLYSVSVLNEKEHFVSKLVLQ
jgi:hypothetical protein